MRTLFENTKIGRLPLQNRFIRAAVTDTTLDGYVDDIIIKKYASLAKGKVGAIVTGMMLVDGEERLLPVVAMCSDSFLSGHRKLVEAVRKYDAKIIAQLAYVGSYAMASDNTSLVALAPSEVSNAVTGTRAREMRLGEIKMVQKKFADAAKLAQDAGYDGIEIHSAHGLLMSQFLTPHYNRREDEYGGPVENRMRMLLETYSAIRTSTGYNFPVWVKLNSMDGIDGGIAEEDFMHVCKTLTRAGVDAIEVSGARTPGAYKPGAYFRDTAAKMAEDNNVAVILTGGNRNVHEMASILEESNIRFFGIARPFFREPDLIEKFRKEYAVAHPDTE
ncbi:MAG: NADH:flavin oxidoreductase [Synergistaceae bacterium]|jgi:2,4-dienoyl-CoA reductase-like NADH-dependent reductase (Old Yellow Enzyme family)|nr:NADH:flavin oxidoreductase [Synergistaceae bacterium]